MSEHLIQIEQHGAVRLLRLNRPEALNAFTAAMLGQLRQALEAAAEDGATRCVLITGAGRAFSAGQDLSDPHVAGVQWGYGAMGNAAWRGPQLRDVLARAGVKPNAVEIWLDGADGPVLPTTPDFRKSLPLAKAMADETIIALSMNGAALPLLNGYPARLIAQYRHGVLPPQWLSRIEEI